MAQVEEFSIFDSNGVPIRYLVKGSGSPVVLLHGLTRNIETAWVTYDFLAPAPEHYNLIAMDCRGHGQSGKPHDPLAYGKVMVDDVIHLLDHLQIERAHLLGHSMGAEIALRATVDYPERVLSSTVAGSGWSDDSAFALYAALADSLEAGEGMRPLLDWWTLPGEPAPTDKQVEELNELMLTGNDVTALAALCRNNGENQEVRVYKEELQHIQTPVLGVVGEHDTEKPMLESMQGVVPNYTLVVLPGLGHTGPEFFSALAREAFRFLDSINNDS